MVDDPYQKKCLPTLSYDTLTLLLQSNFNAEDNQTELSALREELKSLKRLISESDNQAELSALREELKSLKQLISENI